MFTLPSFGFLGHRGSQMAVWDENEHTVNLRQHLNN